MCTVLHGCPNIFCWLYTFLIDLWFSYIEIPVVNLISLPEKIEIWYLNEDHVMVKT